MKFRDIFSKKYIFVFIIMSLLIKGKLKNSFLDKEEQRTDKYILISKDGNILMLSGNDIVWKSSLANSILDTNINVKNLNFKETNILPGEDGYFYLIDKDKVSQQLDLSIEEIVRDSPIIYNAFKGGYFFGRKKIDNFYLNITNGNIFPIDLYFYDYLKNKNCIHKGFKDLYIIEKTDYYVELKKNDKFIIWSASLSKFNIIPFSIMFKFDNNNNNNINNILYDESSNKDHEIFEEYSKNYLYIYKFNPIYKNFILFQSLKKSKYIKLTSEKYFHAYYYSFQFRIYLSLISFIIYNLSVFRKIMQMILDKLIIYYYSFNLTKLMNSKKENDTNDRRTNVKNNDNKNNNEPNRECLFDNLNDSINSSELIDELKCCFSSENRNPSSNSDRIRSLFSTTLSFSEGSSRIRKLTYNKNNSYSYDNLLFLKHKNSEPSPEISKLKYIKKLNNVNVIITNSLIESPNKITNNKLNFSKNNNNNNVLDIHNEEVKNVKRETNEIAYKINDIKNSKIKVDKNLQIAVNYSEEVENKVTNKEKKEDDKNLNKNKCLIINTYQINKKNKNLDNENVDVSIKNNEKSSSDEENEEDNLSPKKKYSMTKIKNKDHLHYNYKNINNLRAKNDQQQQIQIQQKPKTPTSKKSGKFLFRKLRSNKSLINNKIKKITITESQIICLNNLTKKYSNIKNFSSSESLFKDEKKDKESFYKKYEEIYKLVNKSYGLLKKNENENINEIIENNPKLLICNSGRFIREFKNISIMSNFGTLFKAKHIIDENFYIIKILKFNIDPNIDLSKNKEIQNVIKITTLEHKNIIRYITSWFEFQDQNIFAHRARALSLDAEKVNSNIKSKLNRKIASKFKMEQSSINNNDDDLELIINENDQNTFNDDKEEEEDDDDEEEEKENSESIKQEEDINDNNEFDYLDRINDSDISEYNNDKEEDEQEDNRFIIFEDEENNNNACNDNNKFCHFKKISCDSKINSKNNKIKRKKNSKAKNNNLNFNDSNEKNDSFNYNHKDDNYPKLISIYFYIQMEFCDGCPFDFYLNNLTKQMDYNLIIRVFQQLCDGLSYLHNQGIIHANLNPKNIFLYKNFKIKIINVGILNKNNTNNNNNLNYIYKSPEQILNKDQNKFLTKKCDIFSLGLILFEMLYYFYDDNCKVLAFDNIRTKNIYPKDINKISDNNYISIIKKMTCIDTANRPCIEDIVNSVEMKEIIECL